MFVLIPCQQPSFCGITINFEKPRQRLLEASSYVTPLSVFYNLTQPFYYMFMQLSSLNLVFLDDHFFERLLRYAK